MLSVLVAGGAAWQFVARTSEMLSVPATGVRDGAIAVLPFTVRAAQGEGPVFFADGIHDDLLTRLKRIPGLRVISRASIARYRDSDESPHQIGDRKSVVEGKSVSVRVDLGGRSIIKKKIQKNNKT